MRELFLRVVVGGAVLAGWCGWGQTHKVAKPESVVRAVGVYEWTGDLAKPKASRLIPVTVPVRACWASAAELTATKAAAPIILAIFMAFSLSGNTCVVNRAADELVPVWSMIRKSVKRFSEKIMLN